MQLQPLLVLVHCQANTLDRLRPLVPFVVLAFFLSRNAEWLAGKACRNHIDKPRVFFRCTGLDEVVNILQRWGLHRGCRL